jgi:hypothetical protein
MTSAPPRCVTRWAGRIMGRYLRGRGGFGMWGMGLGANGGTPPLPRAPVQPPCLPHPTRAGAATHLRTTIVVLTGLADTTVMLRSSTLPVPLTSSSPSSSGW